MVSPAAPEFDRVVFDSGTVRIGAFRCHRDHPRFSNTGPAENFCFVFPRTAVEIRHEHERAFVANPNVVTFYNRGQAYERGAISASGDQCDWFGVAADIVRDAVRTFEPRVDDRPERPFRFTRTFTDPRTYLLQRRVFERVSANPGADPLWVEEEVVFLLERVLGRVYEQRRRPPLRRKRDAVHHVEVLLSSRCDRNIGIAELAAETGMSMFHLCRTFRAATGKTLHQYRTQFRVRSSLEAVCKQSARLVETALDAGFSSHSHFTSSFRKEFGWTPSQARELISEASF